MQNRLFPCIAVTVIMLLPVFLSGCGTKSVEPWSPPQLISLSVNPVNSSIAPGTATQLRAMGVFSDNFPREITGSVLWSSSDIGIATISNVPGSAGRVTATSNIGSTTITAASGGVTGSATLTTSPVGVIDVTPISPTSIAPGTTQQFTASGTLQDSTVQNLTTWVNWSSTDTGIATVSNIGLATANTPGTTSIQAAYGGIAGSTTLTSSALTSIAVTPTSKSIPKGTTQQFTAFGTLADATAQDLTTWVAWSSSSMAIATIGNLPGLQGLASAIQVGFTGISGTFSLTTSNSATLTVTPAVVVSIAVTPSNRSIALGKTQQYTATGTFTDQTIQDITSVVAWSSSNAGIGTISNASASKGLFMSLSEGTTEITATLAGVTSVAAILTVTPVELESIVVSPNVANLIIPNQTQFSAAGTYSDGTIQDITTEVEWFSSDPAVAIISNAPGFEGLATFSLHTGSTFISASLLGITSNQATLTVTHF